MFDISNKHQSYGVLFVDVLTIIESCSLTITTIAIKLSIDSFLSTFSMKNLLLIIRLMNEFRDEFNKNGLGHDHGQFHCPVFCPNQYDSHPYSK
ncbi:hypothetical protein [Shewanella ulleungensis]|uniref:Uncharacterized protein n=1 Tax=Shewanella ulleungensis TaxID=2282699 RepID=A0ABQ2QNM8_9GAMM|nr:hypothetical protein GCM10009410_21400 [Shewanella ulleungensis]